MIDSAPRCRRLGLLVFLLVLFALVTGCDRTPVRNGLYYWGHEVNVVCPCGSTECFWVKGTPEVLDPLRIYVQKQTTLPYQPVFLSYQGRILDEPTSGFAANYEGYLAIHDVRSVSATLPDDCPPP